MLSCLTDKELAALEESGLPRESPYIIQGVSHSQFSIARFYGGVIAYGQRYTYNPQSDELCRDDVLKWLKEFRKKKVVKKDTGRLF